MSVTCDRSAVFSQVLWFPPPIILTTLTDDITDILLKLLLYTLAAYSYRSYSMSNYHDLNYTQRQSFVTVQWTHQCRSRMDIFLTLISFTVRGSIINSNIILVTVDLGNRVRFSHVDHNAVVAIARTRQTFVCFHISLVCFKNKRVFKI